MARDTSVRIVDVAYAPASITINQGDVVTWTNTGALDHTVTADDGSFDSGTLAPGDPFANLFDKAGTFRYHCTIHPAEMIATVVVKAVSGTPVPSGPTPPPGTLPPNFNTPVPADSPSPSTVPAGTPSSTPAATGTTAISTGLVGGLLLVALLAASALAFVARARRSRR
jgi:hypothetical protein